MFGGKRSQPGGMLILVFREKQIPLETARRKGISERIM